jgi:hypothetical protein
LELNKRECKIKKRRTAASYKNRERRTNPGHGWMNFYKTNDTITAERAVTQH